MSQATGSKRKRFKKNKDLLDTTDVTDKQTFALVYFPDEVKYSVVRLAQVTPNEAQLNDVVSVKGRGKQPFKAKLINKGKESFLVELRKKLEAALNIAEKASKVSYQNDSDVANDFETTDSSELSLTGDEDKENHHENIAVLKTCLAEKEKLISNAGVSINIQDAKSINENLTEIKHLLGQGLAELKTQTALLKSPSTPSPLTIKATTRSDSWTTALDPPRAPTSLLSSPSTSSAVDMDVSCYNQNSAGSAQTTSTRDGNSTVTEVIMYNDVNLLAIPAKAKEPTRYVTKLMEALFTPQEMADGWVPPMGRTKKTPLDPTRLELIYRCVSVRYGEKAIGNKGLIDVRKAICQKCLDKKKKERQSAEQ